MVCEKKKEKEHTVNFSKFFRYGVLSISQKIPAIVFREFIRLVHEEVLPSSLKLCKKKVRPRV